MGRVQTAGEATSRPWSPSHLPLCAHFHRQRDIWVRGSYFPMKVAGGQVLSSWRKSPGPARLLMTALWLFTYPQLPSFFSKAPLELLSFPVFFFLTLLSPASSQLAFHSSVQVVFSSACSFPAAAEILGVFLRIFCALLVLSQISTKSKYYCNFHLTLEGC